VLASAVIRISVIDGSLIDRERTNLEIACARELFAFHDGDVALSSIIIVFRDHYRINVIIFIHIYMLWLQIGLKKVAGRKIMTARRIAAIYRSRDTGRPCAAAR